MLTIDDSLKRLKEKGYEKDFAIQDGKILDQESKNKYSPEKMQVDDIYRVDEDSGGGGQSAVYAISSIEDSQIKGVLVAAHGRYIDQEDLKVIKKLEDHHTH